MDHGEWYQIWKQECMCNNSKIRADILMMVFDVEEQIAWEEALEKFHAHMKSWNELTDEEKRAWWLEE
jgi:hypothetical protein